MSDGPVRKDFLDAGVELQIDDGPLARIATCDIAEDDPRWEKVRHLLKKYQLVDIPFTKFTNSELLRAKYLNMGSAWHHQHFGSGASARRAVLLSNALYRRIGEAALNGAEFYACK
jgi:hypothetical protein